MLQFVASNQTNPYLNIAVENHLVALPDTDAITLYLWRNRRTVVIGQNQNPFSECNLEALEADGGYLMRRKTGGGAVYHDDGNLNFSFVVPKAHYDLQRQFSVIQRAVQSFGLNTELSGRNDILCEGRKFSGNAFSKGRTHDLHHGTILIRGNMSDLQRYLKPKPAKLLKHGVNSVQSRVVNLADLNPDITPDTIAPRLLDAFQEVYGGQAVHMDYDTLCQHPDAQKLYQEFSSDSWRYGNWRTFTAQRSAQFDWGGIELALNIENDIITHVQLASDALDLAALDEARTILTGASAAVAPQSENPILKDIFSLIYN